MGTPPLSQMFVAKWDAAIYWLLYLDLRLLASLAGATFGNRRGARVFISLQQLEKRAVPFAVDIRMDEIDYGSEISQSSILHAEGSARLLNHSLGEVRVQGDLKVTMQATCDRCLEAATFPVERHFDLIYMPSTEAQIGGEEVHHDGIEVGFYEGNGLALNDILREVVLLALPMQLVCNEACKGICPMCGQNRNQHECGCQPEPVDNRWSKLKTFRTQIGPHN